MIDWVQVERILSIWGLPLAILVVGGYLVMTERFVTGSSATRRETVYKDLWLQERGDHQDTKTRLDRSLKVSEDATVLSANYERLVRERLS